MNRSVLAIRRKREAGNASVIIFIAILVAIGFTVLAFVRPWYKSWKAKNLVGEAIAGNSVEIGEDDLKESIIRKLKEADIEIYPDDIEMEIDRENRLAKVKIEWEAPVKIPIWEKKITTIKFYIKAKRKLR